MILWYNIALRSIRFYFLIFERSGSLQCVQSLVLANGTRPGYTAFSPPSSADDVQSPLLHVSMPIGLFRHWSGTFYSHSTWMSACRWSLKGQSLLTISELKSQVKSTIPQWLKPKPAKGMGTQPAPLSTV